MEEEAAKIEAMQTQVEQSLKPAAVQNGPDVDSRSIYVGNVCSHLVQCSRLGSFMIEVMLVCCSCRLTTAPPLRSCKSFSRHVAL